MGETNPVRVESQAMKDLGIDPHTLRKAGNILQRGSHHLTGLVMRDTNGGACIVELGAVRWLSLLDAQALMHPSDGSGAALASEDGTGGNDHYEAPITLTYAEIDRILLTPWQPCPDCKAQGEQLGVRMIVRGRKFIYFVECSSCSRKGPRVEASEVRINGDASAIEFWNRAQKAVSSP